MAGSASNYDGVDRQGYDCKRSIGTFSVQVCMGEYSLMGEAFGLNCDGMYDDMPLGANLQCTLVSKVNV